MKINVKRAPITTHEGGVAKHINNEQELRRSLMTCMLWEKTFYEDGEAIADRILRLTEGMTQQKLYNLAIEARTEFKLRHAPLLILIAMIKKGGNLVAKAITDVINRPDEITELVAIYWKDGKKPLSKQMKLGLGNAFNKFNEYQLSKWNKPGAIKLRDVLFLSHAKPIKQNEGLFKRLADNTLATPDTWESRMAGGQDKREVFTDLLKRNKLGYMALLRNLRGMTEAGVSEQLIRDAIAKPSSVVLPYRFIAASKYAPQFEPQLDTAMLKLLENKQRLGGKTIMLLDVSGSMFWSGNSRSEMNHIDYACGLAIMLAGICDDFEVFTFSMNVVQVPARQGMALRDAIVNSQQHGGTYLGGACEHMFARDYDRLVVLTDEQSHDRVPDPYRGKNYMINIASYQNGVGYGPWTHIDGFSEACVDFIQQLEEEGV